MPADGFLSDAITMTRGYARQAPGAFTFDQHFRQYGRIHVLGLGYRLVA